MSYTAFDDTFAGTAGQPLTGAGGSPVASASDAWGTFSPFSPLVYKAGGGATSATFAGGAALSTYPLTGVAQDQDITVTISSAVAAVGSGPSALIQFHRTADGNNYTSLTVNFDGMVVALQSGTGGTAGAVINDNSAGNFTANTPYTLRIVTSGGTIATATLNGVTLAAIQGQSIPTGSGTVLLLGQANGSAGDLTFSEVRVQVAGPSAATVTGSTALTTGTPSSNYTITLDSAVPAGGRGIALTPAASGFTAAATPSTVTIASGATSGTFTETSSTTGTGTVSATSPGIAVTGQSVTSSAPLVAGAATAGSTTASTAAATATDAAGGATPYAYQWYRSTASGTLGTAVPGQTTRTLADSGLAASTSYFYTLRYTDAASNHADSNQVAEATPAGSGALAAGAVTAGSTTSATAAATATDASGGTSPYGYQWYRSTTSGSLGSAVPGQTTRTLADSGLSASTTYYYTLRYTDASSAHADSNQVTEATPAAQSSAPSGKQLEVRYPTPSLATAYFLVARAGGQAWNGASFEAEAAGNWPSYAIAAADPGGTGRYLADFPAAIAPGVYSACAFLRAGGSPAPSDAPIGGQADGTWDGSTFGPSTAAGSFPSACPTGWIHDASFAADAKVDGTMRLGSTPAAVYFDAGDRIANALAVGVCGQYITIATGPGTGQQIPIASVSGASGARVGAIDPSYTLLTPLTTSSAYYWPGRTTSGAAGGGAGTLDLGQTGIAFRPLDQVPDDQITLGDALACAVAAAAGKSKILANGYVVMSPSDGTVIRTFRLDSSAAPTQRN